MKDVVVVGGGPAGSAVAIHLAASGYDVTVLERSRHPRRKPCGEGLLPLGVAALADLGVADEVEQFGAPLRAVRFRSGSNTATGRFLGGHGLGVERTILDYQLLQRARRAGAEVREGVAVRSLVCDEYGLPFGVLTDSGVERGKVIIAADGLHSRLRRQAGLDRGRAGQRFAVTAHVTADSLETDLIEIVVQQPGEIYVTPVGGGRFNVACLGSRSLVRDLAADGWSGFREFLERGLSPGGRLELCDAPAPAGPFPVASRRAHRGRLVLAGDAAGFFDGITGEGMSLALQNGRLLAEAVGQALATNRTAPFRAYEREVRRRARNSTLIGRLSLLLARHPRMATHALRNFARHPATLEKLIAINSGEEAFASLRPREVGHLLDPRGLVR